MSLSLKLSPPQPPVGYSLTLTEQGRALLWMRRNADSIYWWLLSTPELRRCAFYRYLRGMGRLHEMEDCLYEPMEPRGIGVASHGDAGDRW